MNEIVFNHYYINSSYFFFKYLTEEISLSRAELVEEALLNRRKPLCNFKSNSKF